MTPTIMGRISGSYGQNFRLIWEEFQAYMGRISGSYGKNFRLRSVNEAAW
jgi:hypothetical protein